MLTLALGIGATTALFSVVHGVLLTPPPYPDPDRIVTINEELEASQSRGITVSYVNGSDWRASTSAFESMAFVRGATLTMTGLDQATNLSVLLADPAYFGIMGARPILGRLPTNAENVVPGGHALAVLSFALWRDHFDQAPEVLGSTIELAGVPYTVLGVLDEAYRDPFPSQSGGATDLWIPSMMAGQVDPRGDLVITRRQVRSFGMFGLLAEGHTAASGEEDLDRIADVLEEAYPGENAGFGVAVTPLSEALSAGIDDTVWLLMGGAVVLLLIACFNVVNLLLVRGSTRQREVSVQMALGAPRARIVRLLSVESGILALFGGLLGLAAARLILPALLGLVPNQLPIGAQVGIDASVLFAMLVLTVAVGGLVGVVPAIRASGVDVQQSMTGARGAVGDRAGDRVRGVLVMLEITTATILLAGTSLLVRGFADISASDPGFETERVLHARVTLAPARYPDLESLAQGIRDLTAAVESVPEVEWATAWGPGRPGQSGFFQTSVPQGMNIESVADSPIGRRQHVGPGTLEAMGIEVVRGRGILTDDGMDTERVAVVSESMAAELWPNEDALGQVFHGFTPVGQPQDPARVWTVVGIAADAQNQGRLPATGTFATRNDAYFPISQRPERSFALLVRTRGEPEIGPIRQAVADFDPDIPVFAVATMRELFALEEAPARFAAILMAVFGGSALMLAGLGVYGVISFTVSQRTREIGLRTALGADRRRTLLHVLFGGMRIAVVGVGLGAFLGLAMGERLVAFSTLIPEPDVFSLFSAGGALLLIAVGACLIPALRATRVAPNVALRE